MSFNNDKNTIRLQVIRRPTNLQLGNTNESNYQCNNFARLTPRIAILLRDYARTRECDLGNIDVDHTTPNNNDNNNRRPRWCVHDEPVESSKCSSGIEFLPLAVTFETTGETIYVSYNGGNIDYSQLHQTDGDDCGNEELFIDLPDSLLTHLTSFGKFDENTKNFVSVEPLRYIDSVSELYVEPVTTEDWELIQLEAISLEEGRFLQQISVVYSGQIFDLTLSTGMMVKLKVLSQNFDITTDNIWPHDEIYARQNHPCFRLLPETQIIVISKPRQNVRKEYPLRLIPTQQDYEIFDPLTIQLAEHLNIKLLNIEQGTLVVHPNTLIHIQGVTAEHMDCSKIMATLQAIPSSASNESNNRTVSATVQVVTSIEVPENHAALHPFVRIQIHASIFSCASFVAIKKFLLPIEIAKYLTTISDLIRKGEATLLLKAVRLHTSNDSTSCRSTNTDASYTFLTNSGDNSDYTKDAPQTIQQLPEFPIDFGRIFSMRSSDGHFRVDLQMKNNLNIENLFLFSSSLWKFYTPCDKSDIQQTQEIVQINDFKSKQTLDRLLPTYGTLLSSFVSLAQGSLWRPSVLVYGDRGCGKTFSTLLIAAVARLIRSDRCVYLNCKKLRDSRAIRMKGILTEVSKTFDDAHAVVPCILILDDLDLLVPGFDGDDTGNSSSQYIEGNQTESDQSKLISDLLRLLMNAKMKGIFVAATAQSPKSLPQRLLSEGNFCHQVEVPSLSGNDRESMYHNFLRRLSPFKKVFWSSESNFVRKTLGFRPRDLEQLAFRVVQSKLSNGDDLSLNQVTTSALDTFKPLSRLASTTDVTCGSKLQLSNIGGLRLAKSDLISTIVRPLRYHRIYDKAKVRLPRGVLLFGFPGTGKSICVPALARECGCPLIVCRGPELLDKYIGASEAKVRELFSRAAATAPSILFFDELDALALRRGSDNTGVTDRIVNQLLTFLDGVEDVVTDGNGPVYVIGSTSRPDKIDPALLRPGRLEKHVYFGLSDDLDEVKDLLLKISENYSIDLPAKTALESGDLVRKTSLLNPKFRFFSAADFALTFRTAQLQAVEKSIALGKSNDTAVVGYDEIFEVMVSARPSISANEYDRLFEIYSSYRHGKPSSSSLKHLQTALK